MALALLFLGLAVYRDFVFGDNTLLYKDIGSDSVNIFYPSLVHFSDYLRSEGFPSWSFYIGMGQNLYCFLGYLIWQPVGWLPRGLIPQGLIFQHLFKILVAGLLFFRFLQLRGLKLPAALLGSLLLSFSAYMCMGSCWYSQADEVVGFTALLFAAEEAVERGRWLYLVLAVALVGFLSAFHLYLCALFLLFYVPLRLFARYSWQPRPILRTAILLALAALLGVGLGSIVILPNLYGLLNSPRGAGSMSAVATLSSFPVFGLESGLHYITACLRPFANDILGTAQEFRGWVNYLEAPVTYCGLVCLVILPQGFIGATRRARVIYALFLSAILILTVFPWFRYLFWLFQGNYYRALSLFSILGIITLSMMAFSRYAKGRGLSLWVLAATMFVLLGILYFPSNEFQTRVDPSLKRAVTIYLLSYAALLAAGQVLKRQEFAAWIIVGLAAIELIEFNRITVSNRSIVSKQELNERVGYNDETVDAVRDIKSNDQSFFRITKTWGSGPSNWLSLNDAMVFGYYGTSSYSSFNNLNYINFLMAVDAMPRNSERGTRFSKGLLGHPI
jgi:uncharacterized membrane protein YfhO